MGINIGIDLGTTYSAVACIDEESGRAVIVRNSSDDTTTPSALCFQQNSAILFGEEAKDEYNAGNPNAVAFYKRNMGSDSYSVQIEGQTYTATDFSAIFLKKLVKDVETQLSTKVDGAVITVPAYFEHKQVEATIQAAKQAGITVLSTIHEPTAAALAYGLAKAGKERTVLFYDLGGGTFDVTIAKISTSGIEVLGCAGNHHLGGKNWDDALARHLVNRLQEEQGIDISDDANQMAVLQGKTEQLKKQLSAKRQVDVPLFINNQRISINVTAAVFAEITESLCAMTFDIIENLFDDLSLTWDGIDSIILIGGSTKMPMIRSFLGEKTSTPIEAGVNVDEAVALGAAIKANVDKGDASGDGKGKSRLMIGGEPLSADFTVTDVVAHTLGMVATNLAGDAYVNSKIIMKNSKIPASKTVAHKFMASARNTEMEIYVLQGEEERPLDNTIINKYVACEIQETKKDGESIDVTYSYDSDGLIVVAASQLGRSLSVKIEQVPEDMSWLDRPPKSSIPSKILLAIDLSGSMSGNPLVQAKERMKEFVNEVSQASLEVGVLLFADHELPLIAPTNNYWELEQKISGITIGQGGVGYGNSTDPFTCAAQLEENDFLIVLTDGVWSNQTLAIERAQKLGKKGVRIIALGFGGADKEFLKKVATEKDFALLTDLSKLGEAFGKIAQVVQTGSGSIALR